MQLKTLFSLLIVSCFLCACANNNNTENASVQTPINTPVESNKKEEQNQPDIIYIPYKKSKPWLQDMQGKVSTYIYLKHTENFDWNDKNAAKKSILNAYINDELLPIDYGHTSVINFAQDVDIEYNHNDLTAYGYALQIDDEMINFCKGYEFLTETSFLQRLNKKHKYYIHCAQIGVYTTFIISELNTQNQLTKYHYIQSPYVYDENEDF